MQVLGAVETSNKLCSRLNNKSTKEKGFQCNLTTNHFGPHTMIQNDKLKEKVN